MTPIEADDRRAMAILRAILSESRGQQLHGKVRLFKNFYYAHVYHWRDAVEPLSSYPIIKLPRGPGIGDFGRLDAMMRESGVWQVSQEAIGPHIGWLYTLADGGQDLPELGPAARNSIRSAVRFTEDKTAAELSELTHEFCYDWPRVRLGELLDVSRDVYEASEVDAMIEVGDQVLAELES